MNNLSKKPSSKKTQPIFTEEEQKMAMIFREIERGDGDKMTEEHISEVLSQRRQVHEYIHEENMQFHERFKIDQNNTLIKIGIIIVFAIFVLILIAYIMPEYLPQTLSLVVGFIGGFGIGKSTKDIPLQNEKI